LAMLMLEEVCRKSACGRNYQSVTCVCIKSGQFRRKQFRTVLQIIAEIRYKTIIVFHGVIRNGRAARVSCMS